MAKKVERVVVQEKPHVFRDFFGDLLGARDRVQNGKHKFGWVIGLSVTRVKVKYDDYNYDRSGALLSASHPVNRGFHSEKPGDLRIVRNTHKEYPYDPEPKDSDDWEEAPVGHALQNISKGEIGTVALNTMPRTTPEQDDPAVVVERITGGKLLTHIEDGNIQVNLTLTYGAATQLIAGLSSEMAGWDIH